MRGDSAGIVPDQKSHNDIACGGDEGGFLLAEVNEEQVGGDEAGDGAAEGVDAVQDADGFADVVEMAMEMVDEDGEGGAHEESGDGQEGKSCERNGEEGAVEG